VTTHLRAVRTSFPASQLSIFVSSLFPIPFTLIHYDQRIRQEGFDIEMMMDAAGMNAVMVGESAERPA